MDKPAGRHHVCDMESGRIVALAPRSGWRAAPTAGGIAGASVFVGVAVLLGHALGSRLPAASLSLIFLAPVLMSAIRYGFWTALLAALLAFFSYNFFFVEPRRTFSVAHAEDALALAIFLLVAAVTGLLAGRLREEADAARRRANVLETLSGFTLDLWTATRVDEIEQLILRHIAGAAGGAVMLKPDGEELRPVAQAGAAQPLEPGDLVAADWVWRHSRPQTATATGWAGSRFAFYPVGRDGTVAAVFGVATTRASDDESAQAVEAMLRQGEVAMERAAFARDAEEARAAVEQERVRSALISSISHDLRTPLATILGSVTSLRQLGDAMPPEARGDLLLAIEEETGRLSRFVANLLAMTRLEAGLDIRLETMDAADVALSAVERARQLFPDAPIFVETGPATGVIAANAALLEQALLNLIDNAVKFSPPAAPVRLFVRATEKWVEFSVVDEGRGVAAQDRERIFDKFYRGEGAQVSGAGLGLAICRGVVAAHGGALHAESPLANGRGTRMRLSLPRIEDKTP